MSHLTLQSHVIMQGMSMLPSQSSFFSFCNRDCWAVVLTGGVLGCKPDGLPASGIGCIDAARRGCTGHVRSHHTLESAHDPVQGRPATSAVRGDHRISIAPPHGPPGTAPFLHQALQAVDGFAQPWMGSGLIGLS